MSSNSDWIYDYATGQEVKYLADRRIWVNRAGRQVNPPQRTPDPGQSTRVGSAPRNVPTGKQTYPSDGRVNEITGSMSNMTVGSPQNSGTRPAYPPPSGSSRNAATTGSAYPPPSGSSRNAATTGSAHPPPSGSSRNAATTGSAHPPPSGSSRNAATTGTARTGTGQPLTAAGPAQAPASGQRLFGFEGTVRDPASGQQTSWEIGPAARYIDPTGSANRGLNYMHIRASTNRPTSQASTYQRGLVRLVIEVPLVPPAESSGLSKMTTNSGTPRNSRVRKRRFVIVADSRADGRSFEALAIKTYNGDGVAAADVVKFQHTIIYTGATPPSPTAQETPRRGSGEIGMQLQPIKVTTFDRGSALDEMSRLDYGNQWFFDHGVPNITMFGRVQNEYLAALYAQYSHIWHITRNNQAPSIAPSYVASIAGSTNTIRATPRPAGANNATNQSSERISFQDMSTLLASYHTHARQRNFPQPPTLTAQQIQHLADNPGPREEFLRRVRQRWDDYIANSRNDRDEEDDDDDDDDGDDGD